MWHKRAHPLAAASPARERAISLSLPRSNGASQSGDTIIASTIQFPLSIIYCLCRTCRKRRRRWKSRFLSGGTESTARQSPARRFSRDLRAPSSPLSPRAGADATGGPAVGLGPGAGLGKATSGPLELSSRWAPAESHRCNVTWGAH